MQSHLLKGEQHSGVVEKCEIASVVVLGRCVCAERELCRASEVALKTFEKTKTTVQSEDAWESNRRRRKSDLSS